MRRLLVPFLVSAILHVVPWWRLVLAPGWPSGAVVAATVVAVLLAVGLPAALLLGRSRGIEGVVTAGAVWLGVVWQLFVWTLAGELLRLALVSAGVPDPLRARAVALVVVGWTVGILGWGPTGRSARCPSGSGMCRSRGSVARWTGCASCRSPTPTSARSSPADGRSGSRGR